MTSKIEKIVSSLAGESGAITRRAGEEEDNIFTREQIGTLKD